MANIKTGKRIRRAGRERINRRDLGRKDEGVRGGGLQGPATQLHSKPQVRGKERYTEQGG